MTIVQRATVSHCNESDREKLNILQSTARGTRASLLLSVSSGSLEALQRATRLTHTTICSAFLTPAGRFTGRSAPRATELLNNKLERPTHTCTHALLNQTCGHRRAALCARWPTRRSAEHSETTLERLGHILGSVPAPRMLFHSRTLTHE